jgi:hypothetical protein
MVALVLLRFVLFLILISDEVVLIFVCLEDAAYFIIDDSFLALAITWALTVQTQADARSNITNNLIFISLSYVAKIAKKNPSCKCKKDS